MKREEIINPETGKAPRGVMPWGTEGNWGHIDLLESRYGPDWKEAIRETYVWQLCEERNGSVGSARGSVNWAITLEWHIEQEETHGA